MRQYLVLYRFWWFPIVSSLPCFTRINLWLNPPETHFRIRSLTLRPAKHCRQAEPAGNALAVAVQVGKRWYFTWFKQSLKAQPKKHKIRWLTNEFGLKCNTGTDRLSNLFGRVRVDTRVGISPTLLYNQLNMWTAMKWPASLQYRPFLYMPFPSSAGARSFWNCLARNSMKPVSTPRLTAQPFWFSQVVFSTILG